MAKFATDEAVLLNLQSKLGMNKFNYKFNFYDASVNFNSMKIIISGDEIHENFNTTSEFLLFCFLTSITIRNLFVK
jgi:hypothetical protein